MELDQSQENTCDICTSAAALKVTPDTHPWFLGEKNKWLNGTVVHIPLNEGANLIRQNVSPYLTHERAEKRTD